MCNICFNEEKIVKKTLMAPQFLMLHLWSLRLLSEVSNTVFRLAYRHELYIIRQNEVTPFSFY